MAEIKVEQLTGTEWGRMLEENDVDLIGVWASLHQGVGSTSYWHVTVAPMEFCRADPLETDVATAVGAAIAEVPGVVNCWQEDREVWVVEGSPTGPALVERASQALEVLRPRLEAEVDSF